MSGATGAPSVPVPSGKEQEEASTKELNAEQSAHQVPQTTVSDDTGKTDQSAAKTSVASYQIPYASTSSSPSSSRRSSISDSPLETPRNNSISTTGNIQFNVPHSVAMITVKEVDDEHEDDGATKPFARTPSIVLKDVDGTTRTLSRENSFTKSTPSSARQSAEVTKLREAQESLVMRLISAENAISRAQHDIEYERATRRRIEDEFDNRTKTMMETLEAERIQTKEKLRQELESSLVSATEERVKVESALLSAQAQLLEKQQQIDTLQANAKERDSQVQQLRDALAAKDSEIHELRRELRGHPTHYANLASVGSTPMLTPALCDSSEARTAPNSKRMLRNSTLDMSQLADDSFGFWEPATLMIQKQGSDVKSVASIEEVIGPQNDLWIYDQEAALRMANKINSKIESMRSDYLTLQPIQPTLSKRSIFGSSSTSSLPTVPKSVDFAEKDEFFFTNEKKEPLSPVKDKKQPLSPVKAPARRHPDRTSPVNARTIGAGSWSKQERFLSKVSSDGSLETFKRLKKRLEMDDSKRLLRKSTDSTVTKRANERTVLPTINDKRNRNREGDSSPNWARSGSVHSRYITAIEC